MSKISRKVIIMLLMLATLAMGSGSAIAGYTITDLGYSQGVAINDLGQVAVSDNNGQAYIYRNGNTTSLGVPAGISFLPSSINNSGQITGYAFVNTLTSFLYSGGTLNNLGFEGQVNAINDKGQMTGAVGYGSNTGMIYDNGVMTYLGSLGGGISMGNAINNSGQVAGSSYNASGKNHPILYSNGHMIDLGTLGGEGIAYGINSSGQVVGYSECSGQAHAFLYSNGNMIDLWTSGNDSIALGINDGGQVVGAAYTANWDVHAFLYSNGTTTDLNTLIDANSGWTLAQASDINNLGQITGYGTINGVQHAFILTPDAAPVPIPAAAWLLGSGLMGLFGARRRFFRA